VLGRNGVEATVQPALSDEEVQGLKKSAHILKDQLIDLSL
jgi:malate/lactate dehydrogenase